MPEEQDREASLVARTVAQNNWAQAKSDMATATTLADAGIYYAAVFFAQQTAEKALRAVCIVRLGRNPRTHSLIPIADALLAPLEVMNAAAELNADYLLTLSVEAAQGVPARMYDRAEAQRHLDAARVILNWVRLMM